MSIFDDIGDFFTETLPNAGSTATNAVASVGSSAIDTIASGATVAANAVASCATDAANRIASGAVSAGNSFVGGVKSGGATAWRATSGEAAHIARSVEGVGIQVSDGLMVGVAAAKAGTERGVEKVVEGAVAVKEFVEHNACNLLVGSGVSTVFVGLAATGTGEVSTATLAATVASGVTIGDGVVLMPAAKALAAVIAKPVYGIPGVSSSGLSESQLERVLTYLIVDACKTSGSRPGHREAIIGSGGQFLIGLLMYGILKLVCEGTVPSGYQAWVNTNEGGLAPTPPISPDFRYFEGQRVAQNGRIYIVLDGRCCHVPDADTYNNLFRDWSGVTDASNAVLNLGPALTRGAFLGHDGRNGGIYLVSNQQKRHIADPATMDKCAFDWNKLRPIGPAEADACTTKRRIDGLTSYIEGTRINTPSDGGIYLVLDGRPAHIPDMTTLGNLFRPGAMLVCNAISNVGTPVTSGAYLGHCESAVFFVNGTTRRHVFSGAVMDKYSFDWAKLRPLSATDASKLTLGAPLV